MTPFDLVTGRLSIVHGAAPKIRARCPAHESHGGTLAVSENREGAVLLKCHAGCSTADVLTAIGLELRDLFVGGDARRRADQERAELRQRYAQSPRATQFDALAAGLAELRARLRAEIGFDRPIRAAELNTVRARVREALGLPATALPPIAPFGWECAPHDADPAWPRLHSRALEEVVMERWSRQQIAAAERWPHLSGIVMRGPASDPAGATREDHELARDRAAAWLREMARSSNGAARA